MKARWKAILQSFLAAVVLLTQTQCALFSKAPTRDIPPHIEKKLGKLAPRGIEDSLATPGHQFSRADYPFDARGNYREEWVVESPAAPVPSRSSSSSSGSSGPRNYVVRRGDTLFSLSRRFDVTLYALRKANNLSGDMIRVGQVLKIPGG